MNSEINAKIISATSLQELKQLLDQARDVLSEEELKELDWSDLPLFSDDEPRDTIGVWSYDATHRLVGEGWELDIEPRPDKPPMRRTELRLPPARSITSPGNAQDETVVTFTAELPFALVETSLHGGAVHLFRNVEDLHDCEKSDKHLTETGCECGHWVPYDAAGNDGWEAVLLADCL